LKALELLVQHTAQIFCSGEIGTRQLANIVYGAACSSRAKGMGALFAALARVAERRIGDFNLLDIRNAVSSFAISGW